VLLGAAIGVSPAVRTWVQPTLEFIRPLPASALLPLAISIFGLNPGMVLFVVAFGAMWPVLLATVHGFAAVEPGLAEVARCLQMSRPAFVWKVGLPNAMPDILAGMRLSMTISLIVAVVGEMIASQSGLGQAILLAARAFRASELFAGIVLPRCLGSRQRIAGSPSKVAAWQHPERIPPYPDSSTSRSFSKTTCCRPARVRSEDRVLHARHTFAQIEPFFPGLRRAAC
jgi:hypothetical protein